MGQPFIFNMLHNFGGIQQLFGRDDIVNTRSKLKTRKDFFIKTLW